MNKYFNVSSIRMMRFLYSLGFEKESYISKNGKERWRFERSDDLDEAIKFFKYMRKKRSCTYGEEKMDTEGYR